MRPIAARRSGSTCRPLEGAALVLGVERPLDMVRSSTNLIGHLVNASYVGAAEGEIDVAASSDVVA